MEADTDTIIIIKFPTSANLFKLFVCKTQDKVIYEEKLIRESKVWYTNEIVIYGYITCPDASVIRDTIYNRFSNNYYSIINDWIGTNATDLCNYLRKLTAKNSDSVTLSMVEKPEKARRRRRGVRNDSDSE